MSLVTKWIKTGKIHDFVFLGKEVIATASGNHVIFYNLVTKEERIEYFNSPARGIGACCLAGHPIVPVFSTAERCGSPKIYIQTYPRIRKVAECQLNRGPNSYLSCCFAGTEYLLSLTSFPNFQLIVWLWRSGEKMFSVDTMLVDEAQTIGASLNAPYLVYQFSPAEGKLMTYEIYSYSKKITVIKNYIKSIQHEIACVCWTNNSYLLLCDVFENVYVVSSDGKKVQQIVSSNIDEYVENQISILSFNNGFVIINNKSEVICYNKSFSENNTIENWNISWSIKCDSHPLKMTLARHKEVILLYCENGKIYELHLVNDNEPKLEEIFSDCQKFTYMCSIKPYETHCVLVNSANDLIVLNTFDGNISASLHMDKEDEVLSMATHPQIPFFAVSTSSGKCISFLMSTKTLKLLETIHLQREPLNKIKFSQKGTALGITSTTSKNIFLLKTVIDEQIKVFSHIKFKKSIIDFLIYENEEILQLLVLVKASSAALVGNCVEIYSVNRTEESFYKKREIYMSNYYQNFEYSHDNMYDFLGSLYLSKQLHSFKFENNYESISLCKAVSSTHNLRKFTLNCSKYYVLTSGFDGFVVIRQNSNLSSIVHYFMVHHYHEKGIKCSVSSSCGSIIVALGRNGSLIGLKPRKLEDEKIVENWKNIKIIKWKYIQNHEFSSIENQTWVEQEESRVIQKETNEALILKNSLITDLDTLKTKMNNLLDLNERKNIESKMPVSTFDLNVEKRQEKIEKALREKEENKTYSQEIIARNSKIVDYIMNKFWNSLEIHDCTLISFNDKIRVDNYPLRYMNKREKMDDFTIELFNIPLSNALADLSDNIKTSIPTMTISQEEPFNKNDDGPSLQFDNGINWACSTSYKWIKDDTQLNLPLKSILENVIYDITACKENELKIYFNKKFNEMKDLKNKLLQEITSRLDRLIKCKSELKNIFGILWEGDEKFTNIKRHSVETPEHVITITKDDISPEFLSNLYLSDEDEETPKNIENVVEKSVINISECELAFRKIKLLDMMDGVLEIRWEDEIRKDVPKPDCLLFKHPSQYDEKDIKAVKLYNEKVEKLQFEREKYKTYLISEITDINEEIKTDIKSFDKKMEEFALEKVKIQSAVLQEFLLRLTNQKNELIKDYEDKRLFYLINKDLFVLENENKTLSNEVLIVEPIVTELKSKYENLNKRDKILESKFRGEFVELKQPMVEHLLRQYKRRPRIGQITCTSLTCLAETNNCLIAGKKSSILPREYLDFLRGMDSLDVMPNSLPPQIDASHWQSLCRLRRNKVEMEIKLRIAALELAEAEQSLLYLQKLNSSAQSRVYFMKNTIEEETLKQLRALKNPEVQLVLKAAQIEIALDGHLSNFENASIVTFQQLTEVNKKILKEGEKKITAMRALIKLKKSIKFRSWKYQCMFKKLKHWKEHLLVLQKTKIGKEMQNYLVERIERKIRYKDVTSCNKMLMSVRKKFQRMLIEEQTGLQSIIDEIRYWHEMNAELITRIELLSLKKQEESSKLEEDHLRKRNRIFRKNLLRSIMERTKLVEKVKESRNELSDLRIQLELLQFKCYPTLRYIKDVSFYRRSLRGLKTRR